MPPPRPPCVVHGDGSSEVAFGAKSLVVFSGLTIVCLAFSVQFTCPSSSFMPRCCWRTSQNAAFSMFPRHPIQAKKTFRNVSVWLKLLWTFCQQVSRYDGIQSERKPVNSECLCLIDRFVIFGYWSPSLETHRAWIRPDGEKSSPAHHMLHSQTQDSIQWVQTQKVSKWRPAEPESGLPVKNHLQHTKCYTARPRILYSGSRPKKSLNGDLQSLNQACRWKIISSTPHITKISGLQ